MRTLSLLLIGFLVGIAATQLYNRIALRKASPVGDPGSAVGELNSSYKPYDHVRAQNEGLPEDRMQIVVYENDAGLNKQRSWTSINSLRIDDSMLGTKMQVKGYVQRLGTNRWLLSNGFGSSARMNVKQKQPIIPSVILNVGDPLGAVGILKRDQRGSYFLEAYQIHISREMYERDPELYEVIKVPVRVKESAKPPKQQPEQQQRKPAEQTTTAFGLTL